MTARASTKPLCAFFVVFRSLTCVSSSQDILSVTWIILTIQTKVIISSISALLCPAITFLLENDVVLLFFIIRNTSLTVT
jgi:hypothetical protein